MYETKGFVDSGEPETSGVTLICYELLVLKNALNGRHDKPGQAIQMTRPNKCVSE